jgi:hypothetical protein
MKTGSGAGRTVVETDYKPWLHSPQNAGIGKKKTKQLTRQQKLRQQRGMEKADVNEAKLEKKIEDSKSRARRVQARAADWEDMNEKIETSMPNIIAETQKSAPKPKTAVSQPVVELDSSMQETDAADVAIEQSVLSPGTETIAKVAELSVSEPAAAPAEDIIDEIT